MCLSACASLLSVNGSEESEAKEYTATETAAVRFLDLWQSGSFEGAYDMLSSAAKKEYDKDTFVQRYKGLYEALEITSVRYILGDAIPRNDGATVMYEVVYNSGIMNECRYAMEMKVVLEDGKWLVNWTPALIFPDLGKTDKVLVTTLLPKRGEIYDCNGRYLAVNDYDTTVFLDYSSFDKRPDMREITLDTLSEKLNIDRAELVEKIDKQSNRDIGLVTLKSFAPETLTDEWKEQLLALPGVGLDTSLYAPVRRYPNHGVLAHFLGYLGAIGENEWPDYKEKGYSPDAKVGVSGLEKAYESQLVGKNGLRVDIFTQERVRKKNLFIQPAQDGYHLRLSIDLEMQLLLETELASVLKPGQAGGAVLLEPETGRVVAIASAPSFDINTMTRGIGQTEFQQLLDDPAKPLFNRATLGRYPPGSTMKPFTAALGLQTGVVNPNYYFQGNIVNNQWKPNRSDWVYPPITRVKLPGTQINMERAIAWSDNIYFAYTIMEAGRQEAVPFLQGLGFEQAIPFDVGVSKAQISNSGYLDDIKLLADTGYGQGELLVSPLQMCSTMGAFLTQGRIMKPTMVDVIAKGDTFEETAIQTAQPTVWLETSLTTDSIQTLMPMMQKVVSDPNGTAKSVATTGLTIAAKTGTAEIGNDKTQEIGWFIGFTSNLERNMLFGITIEAKTREAGAPKLTIARAMFRRIAQNNGLIPYDTPSPPGPTPTVHVPVND